MPHNPFMPRTQSQQEANPYCQEPHIDDTAAYSPDNSYNPTHHSPPPMNTQTSSRQPTEEIFNYRTPQAPLPHFQYDSMTQFGQPYRPQPSQLIRPNFEHMGTQLNYGSAVGSNPPAIGDNYLQIYPIRRDPLTKYLFLRLVHKDHKHLGKIVDLGDRLMHRDVEQ